MPTGQFFSHVTAALLHGLPLPLRLLEQTDVDVGTNLRTRRRKGRGVRGHLIPAEHAHVILVDQLPVSSAIDVWTQLSAVLTLDELVMLGDALVRRHKPLATMEELAAAVTRHTGHSGARRLREALTLVRPRTDSARETQTRLLIVRAGLPEPEVNPALTNRFGEFLAYGDLVYRQYKILIEYDGGHHRDDEVQFHRDIDRLDALMAEGWRVIKVNKTHLGSASHATAERIRRALLDAGWRPGE